MEQEINSKVWQLGGIFSTAKPGILSLQEGKVSFATEQGAHFSVPVADLKDVKWPALQMGLGFTTLVNGQKYKFTFMKPNGAAELNDSTISKMAHLTRVGMAIDSFSALAKWGDSKKSAKDWKALLGN